MDTEYALGGKIMWRDLAHQLADVWWHLSEIGGNLQHGDLDKEDCTFSAVCVQHGGQVFHGETPQDAWRKAKTWLMSPERRIESTTESTQ